ncbi:MAG: hypothetical protein ACI9IV_001473, partial [Paracoccaceae bacterium]
MLSATEALQFSSCLSMKGQATKETCLENSISDGPCSSGRHQ